MTEEIYHCLRRIILLTACWFLTLYASAFPFISISTPEGLSNRHVTSMTVDANGYYWFATHTGIDRFNGRDFYHYRLYTSAERPEEVPPGGVFKSDTNDVLAFSEHNVFRYSAATDSFEPIPEVQTDSHRIISAESDPEGRLWIGTSKGLYVFGHDGRLIGRACEKLVVYDISRYSDAVTYVGTSKGIRKISHPSGGKISEQIPLRADELRDKRIQHIYCDPDTKLIWAGSFDGSLYTFDTHSGGGCRTIEHFKRPIRKIVPIDTDRVWVGVDGKGLFVFNRFSLAPIEQFTPEGDALHRFSGSNGVYDICDDGRLIWICTYSNGILVYDKTMPLTAVFTEKDFNMRDPSDAQVNCIHQDRRGRIWFGTNSGISRLDPASQTWKHFTMPNEGSSTVLTMMEDRHGNIWAGGFMFDVVCIDSSDRLTTPAVSNPRTFLPRNVYSIYEDAAGNLYFGGIINAMARYNPSDKTLTNIPIRGIYQILSLQPQHLLMATTKGIVEFNTATMKQENTGRFSAVNNLKAPITRLCVNPSDSMELWIGTENKGLASLNLSTGEFHHFTMAQGLSAMSVCGLEFDKFNRLWASTDDGLNCITAGGNITALFKAEGLPNRTMKSRSHYRLANGNLIWGTTTGAFILRPEDFVNSEKKLNLHFEKFSLFGSEVIPGTEGSPLPQALDYLNGIDLSHSQNNFNIDFSNVGFQNEAAFQYSYFLEGFDKGWTEPSSTTSAHYTNVPPGKYIFRVRVSEIANPGNNAERSIILHVAQPWYNSFWAWLVYLILAAMAIFIACRLYRRWMSVRDSDQKVKFFVNLAHDLRTPLTLIKAPLQEIDTDTMSADGKSALNLARKNTDKLLTMVNQLLDFQKIEREAMSLKVEETNIGEFLQELSCGFIPLAQAKNITLKIAGTEAKGYIDRKKLTAITDNLLSNAIKYTEIGGNVAINWHVADGILEIRVTDDGIGISAADQKKLFTRFYRADNTSNSAETGSGIGLLLTKKMTILHKGSIELSSELGVGTSVIITIPVEKHRYNANEILAVTHRPMPDAGSDDTDENTSDSRLSLMLVEDNDELRQYLEHNLGKRYAVSVFANGDSALASLKSVMPDFVLSDVMMPGLSGLELCSRIKNDIETSHIPVILLTSLAEREDIIRGFNAGADDYITKPFDIFILNKKIANIIHARKAFKEMIVDKTDDKTPAASAISEIDKEFMHRVVQIIEDNITNEEFSINDLAAEMAMSRSVFFKKIKAITAQNPQELIRDIKMRHAADLVIAGQYSISEIAYMTGFPNPKYFSTAFKKYFGVSPSRYAESRRS